MPRPPIIVDEDGVRHRLWAVPADGDDAAALAPLIAVAAGGPVYIADGHHRYETALRYRDERRMTRSCEEDPAFDYLLTLFVDAAGEQLTVLPTHRVVRGLGDDGVARLWAGLDGLFEVQRDVPRDALVDRFDAAALAPGGAGRFGLWTRGGGALLTARRDAFEPFLPAGGDAVRGLDVTLLGVALERLAGLDADAVASGAIGFTKSASEAVDLVDAGRRWRGRRVPPRADADRIGHRGRQRRRRDAAEVDVFLSEGPDRPRHQPARMVNLHARHDA